MFEEISTSQSAKKQIEALTKCLDPNKKPEFATVVKMNADSNYKGDKTILKGLIELKEDGLNEAGVTKYNNWVDRLNTALTAYSKSKDIKKIKIKLGSAKVKEYSIDELKEAIESKVSGQYGHEFSDLINGKSTKSDIYYSPSSGSLVKIAKVSHSSSKNGHSIFWEEGNDFTTILAIGEHDKSTPSGLKKGSVYKIIKAFDDTFNNYEKKLVGFEA